MKRIKPIDPLIGFKMSRGQSPSQNPEEVVIIELRDNKLKIHGELYSTNPTSENYLSINTQRTERKSRVLKIEAPGYLVRRLNELQQPYREIAEQALGRVA